MRKKTDCLICMSEILTRDKKVLKCKHAFHKDCIKKVFEYSIGNGLCPVCRAPFRIRIGEKSRERMQEIYENNEQEDMQELVLDDERYNQTIDELCLKFTNLFQESEMLITKTDLEMEGYKNEILHILTSHYR